MTQIETGVGLVLCALVSELPGDLDPIPPGGTAGDGESRQEHSAGFTLEDSPHTSQKVTPTGSPFLLSLSVPLGTPFFLSRLRV